VKKFKLTLKSGKERYKISDDTLEELTQKLVNKNVSFEKLEIDHRHKICEVPDCNNNATHGQHEIRQGGKIIKEHWKCKRCYERDRKARRVFL